MWLSRNYVWWLNVDVMIDDYFVFLTVHTVDRRTDRQTDVDSNSVLYM